MLALLLITSLYITHADCIMRFHPQPYTSIGRESETCTVSIVSQTFYMSFLDFDYGRAGDHPSSCE